MKKSIVAALTIASLLTVTQAAWAFDCGNRFKAADAAIAEATTAMNKLEDATAKGLVHTFIDDAKMMLKSAKHNHAKPAAGKYDHGRAMAKANTAEGYARAALVLANN